MIGRRRAPVTLAVVQQNRPLLRHQLSRQPGRVESIQAVHDDDIERALIAQGIRHSSGTASDLSEADVRREQGRKLGAPSRIVLQGDH